MVMLLALVIVAAIVWLLDRTRIPFARLKRAVVALALGALMVLVTNGLVTGRFGWTPGGYALSFGRMLEDGIVTRYLDDHCPDPTLRLCAYKNELPNDADDFFWGGGAFDKLGRFDGLRDEMRRIALQSLADYPLLQLKSVVAESARQLAEVDTGAGVVNWIWNTYRAIETYTPHAVPAMKAARQQRGTLFFDAINRVQVPLAFIAMALLPVIAIVGVATRKVRPISANSPPRGTLPILANAAVFGTLATAHNRYGARIVWLAALVVLIALIRSYEARRETPRLAARLTPRRTAARLYTGHARTFISNKE